MRPLRPAPGCLACALALLTVASTTTLAGDEHAFFHEHVMGTALELRVVADSPAAARRAEARVLAEIDRLAAIFSNHDPASTFRRWQDTAIGTAAPLPPELIAVLAQVERWRVASGGAFDARAGAVVALWDQAASAGRTPTAAELDAVRARLVGPAWELEAAAGTARRLGGTRLTLDAIAKGFILDRAADAGLDRADGVRGLLLNVGGDLRAVGAIDRPIGLAPARGDSETAGAVAFVRVRDRSVATSGASQRGWSIGGRWYSHIVDPRTARPVERVIQATVIAPRGSDADALATLANVLDPAETIALVESIPEAACRIVTAEGVILESPRWPVYTAATPAGVPFLGAPAQDPAPAADPANTWAGRFELAVNLEIDQPKVDRYRRPYVVIWAEDAEGRTVRTVILWVSLGGSGPDRWLPDLKRWYRGDAGRTLAEKKNLIYSTARPTRPPGKYTAVWDGLDDRGKPVPKGDYTLFLETAREQGPTQLIRQKVTLGDDPFGVELKGHVEIKSAAIEYRVKPEAGR